MATKSPSRVELAFAVVCERVLQETDGALTIVRLIDTIQVQLPSQIPRGTAATAGGTAGTVTATAATGVADQVVATLVTVALQVAIGIRSQRPVSGRLDLIMRSPSGRGGNPMAVDVKQSEGSVGTNVVVPFLFVAQEIGLYWIEVSFREREIARIPLRVQLAGAVQLSPA